MQAPQRIHCKIGSNSVPNASERPLSKTTTQKSSGPSTSPSTFLPEKVQYVVNFCPTAERASMLSKTSASFIDGTILSIPITTT